MTMQKVLLVTPVKESGVEPFIVKGNISAIMCDGERIFYAGGASYPESIAKIVTRYC